MMGLTATPCNSSPCSPSRRSLLQVHLLSDQARTLGNSEGTPTRARTSTHGHSFSSESSDLRDFRVRRDQRSPAFPIPDFDGKEGVDGSSPSEGSFRKQNRPQMGGFSLPRAALRSTSLIRRAARRPMDDDRPETGLNPANWRPGSARERIVGSLGTGFGDARPAWDQLRHAVVSVSIHRSR